MMYIAAIFPLLFLLQATKDCLNRFGRSIESCPFSCSIACIMRVCVNVYAHYTHDSTLFTRLPIEIRIISNGKCKYTPHSLTHSYFAAIVVASFRFIYVCFSLSHRSVWSC